jgi:hypothetical protein
VHLEKSKAKIDDPNLTTEQKSFSVKCSICLDDFLPDQETIITKCFHRFHVECLTGLISPECPECRAPLEGSISKKLKDAIAVNKKKYAVEKEEDHRRMVLDMLRRESGLGSDDSLSGEDANPQLEIILAMRYAHELGFNLRAIPEMSVISTGPHPQRMTLFNTTVFSYVEHILAARDYFAGLDLEDDAPITERAIDHSHNHDSLDESGVSDESDYYDSDNSYDSQHSELCEHCYLHLHSDCFGKACDDCFESGMCMVEDYFDNEDDDMSPKEKKRYDRFRNRILEKLMRDPEF